jgi:hypothetical protein
MPGQIHQARDGGKRHLAAQGEDQRLEQQGEARQFASPVRFDQTHPAIGQAHPWHAYFEVALVLEEVEVPQPLGHGVVRRMCALDARNGKPTAGNEIDTDRQRLLGRIEIDPSDEPRIGNPQGGFKQLGTHASISSRRTKGRACYTAQFSMAGRDKAPHPAMGQRMTQSCASRVRSVGLRPPLTRSLGPPFTHSFFK